jgi:hypothetical protein
MLLCRGCHRLFRSTAHPLLVHPLSTSYSRPFHQFRSAQISVPLLPPPRKKLPRVVQELALKTDSQTARLSSVQSWRDRTPQPASSSHGHISLCQLSHSLRRRGLAPRRGPTCRQRPPRRSLPLVYSFSTFEFVSDFELRISIFPSIRRTQ